MRGTHRKMLSDWEAPYLQAMARQIETQSKETLARWAVVYAERVILPLWTSHNPGDERPREALDAAKAWLSGEVTLPQAKPAILACHAAAREAADNPVAQAAARAIGQCASTIHSARHCIGLALYGALALAYHRLGTQAGWDELESAAAKECESMLKTLLEVSVPDEPKPAKFSWQC